MVPKMYGPHGWQIAIFQTSMLIAYPLLDNLFEGTTQTFKDPHDHLSLADNPLVVCRTNKSFSK